MDHPETPAPPFFPLPAQTSDRHLIVPLPGEIDLLNAVAVRDALLSAITRGASTVIADMTRTRFCDAAGCRAVTDAGDRARQLGTRLRAVVSDPAVRRVFRLTGADELVEVSLTVDGAPAVGRACLASYSSWSAVSEPRR
jgi:anti-anti-sigma factor